MKRDHRARVRWILLLLLAVVMGVGGCFNDGFTNSGSIGGGGRFALVIEPGRTSVDGTHFLLDTATGDLWRLASDGTSWVRLSEGPTDVTELTVPHLIGVEVPPES